MANKKLTEFTAPKHTTRPLKEHYENDIGHLAVFDYIEDLEKYIDYLENAFNNMRH